MIGKIEIPKRAMICTVCGVSFSSGTSLASTLCLGDKGSIIRFDTCLSCNEPSETSKKISYWKTVVPSEKKTLGLKQKANTAKGLFEKLFIESTEPSLKLFILALYLERRRLLVRRDLLKEEGNEIILFESISSGDIYPIMSMTVDESTISQIGEDLKSLL